jgi:restriction system protein
MEYILLIIVVSVIVFLFFLELDKLGVTNSNSAIQAQQYRVAHNALSKYKNNVLAIANKVTNKHAKQLAIERKKAVFLDPYGKPIFTQWTEKERAYFIEKYIFSKVEMPTDPEIDADRFLTTYADVYNEVIELVEEVATKTEVSDVKFDPKMTGLQFEFFCEQKLSREGWTVTRTKGSGDQGIDLVIKKGKRKIGVQCKKFAKPVGNKAVQEVTAGIAHYKLNEGIVLSNSTYTKSAIQLAGTNNVRLFHYLETENI